MNKPLDSYYCTNAVISDLYEILNLQIKYAEFSNYEKTREFEINNLRKKLEFYIKESKVLIVRDINTEEIKAFSTHDDGYIINLVSNNSYKALILLLHELLNNIYVNINVEFDNSQFFNKKNKLFNQYVKSNSKSNGFTFDPSIRDKLKSYFLI